MMKKVVFLIVILWSTVGYAQSWRDVKGTPAIDNISIFSDFILYQHQLYKEGGIIRGSLSSSIGSWDGNRWSLIEQPDSLTKLDIYPDLFTTDSKNLYYIFSGSGNLRFKNLIYKYDGKTWKYIDSIPRGLRKDGINEFVYYKNRLIVSSYQRIGNNLFSYAYEYANGNFSLLIDSSDSVFDMIEVIENNLYSNEFDRDFQGNPCNTPPCAYDGTSWQKFPKSSSRYIKSIVTFNNNITIMGQDRFLNADNNPLRMVQLWTGAEWVSIGDPSMYRYGDGKLLTHKGELYAVGELEAGGGFVFKYNGLTWDALTPDSINAPVHNAIVYKDELYIQGEFTKIGNQDIKGMARLPLLNKLNLPPTVQSEQVSSTEDIADTLHIKSNDSDANEDYLLCSIINAPKHGTATVLPSDELYYSPTTNYHGSDSITYSMCDRGGLCDTATVSITIQAVNDAPVCVSDNVSTFKNQAIIIYPLQNDTDAENHSIDLQLITTPQFGTANFSKDTIFYTPQVNSIGTDIFFYTACDELNACSQGKVSVLVKNGTSGVGNAQLQAFTVYPNPSHSDVHVVYTAVDRNADAEVLVFDIMGRIVARRELPQGVVEQVISTDTFAPGTYYCAVQQGSVLSKRLSLIIIK